MVYRTAPFSMTLINP